ncbi:MAG: ABC transporter permease [Deinococcota bacterium]
MHVFIRRILWLPVVLWAVASLTFLALRIVPGNPVESVANQILDPEQLAKTEALWGLNEPLWKQYGVFVGDLLRADLGVSMSSGVPLRRLLFERLPATIELAVVALILSTLMGAAAGIVSSTSRQAWLDASVRGLSVLGLSLPLFWVAIMLIVVFAVRLGAFPVGGRINARLSYETLSNFMLIDFVVTGNWPALRSALWHLTLPALSIGLTSAGFAARITRSAMLEVVRADYTRTARAKGLLERTVILKHAFRNALLPLLTLQGLQFGTLLGGAVITEIVFTWPGMGRMLLDGILKRDYPVVQGAVICVAFAYVLMNLIVDLLYYAIDPRLRSS